MLSTSLCQLHNRSSARPSPAQWKRSKPNEFEQSIWFGFETAFSPRKQLQLEILISQHTRFSFSGAQPRHPVDSRFLQSVSRGEGDRQEVVLPAPVAEEQQRQQGRPAAKAAATKAAATVSSDVARKKFQLGVWSVASVVKKI